MPLAKLVNNDISIEITVDGHLVRESESERLLGVIINNVMTWEHHLYGNDDHKGLVQKLSQRAYVIWKLSKMMPRQRLKLITEGIFFSLLNYCIEVYGNNVGDWIPMMTRLGTAQLSTRRTTGSCRQL